MATARMFRASIMKALSTSHGDYNGTRFVIGLSTEEHIPEKLHEDFRDSFSKIFVFMCDNWVGQLCKVYTTTHTPILVSAIHSAHYVGMGREEMKIEDKRRGGEWRGNTSALLYSCPEGSPFAFS